MQVILTEEEYEKLKMDAAKQSAPDHVAIQNCALKTIENFKEFCDRAKMKNPNMWMTIDPDRILNDLIQNFKVELQLHFVR